MSLSVGGVNFTSSAPNNVVVDSGTSLFTLNTPLYNAIIQQFFSTPDCFVQNGYTTCNCNDIFPSLNFTLANSVKVSIPGTAYQFNNGDGTCTVYIQSQSQSQIVLGDTFMRGYVITFDRIHNRIGFYLKPVQTVNVISFSYNPPFFIASQFVLFALNVIAFLLGLGLCIRARYILN